MSYTSGRTVKSTARRLPSPTAVATRAIRTAIKATSPTLTGITISTRLGYDYTEDITTTVSSVTYPRSYDRETLTKNLYADASVMRVSADEYGMTVTRRA